MTLGSYIFGAAIAFLACAVFFAQDNGGTLEGTEPIQWVAAVVGAAFWPILAFGLLAWVLFVWGFVKPVEMIGGWIHEWRNEKTDE